MLIIKMILGLLVFLILLFFSNINMENVRLFYTQQNFIEVPLFLLLLISLLIGMVVALLISVYEKLKLKGQIRALKKTQKSMEGELASLRKIPIMEKEKPPVPVPPAPHAAKEL
ncbi:MAG: DUF1049 domain-containing protein [Deltaproteobacteria bacterium]|nr:DUF1049 domain-containing protein [Deltaproteobacteria bacterium]